ncbi:MAG: polyribonucleotide nucleotidyltransferase [Gammaproteobacteria bacterium]
MPVYEKILPFGKHQLTIQTGLVAKQASASVMVSLGDTMVLVAVVGAQSKEDAFRDFFPLRVDYQERFYAAGEIPGGFFKREGKPTEREVLISRLIDRPIRPLFPEGFQSEVQVVATVLSLDPQIDSDIPAMIGASAALTLSGIPFNGPMGASKVGYLNGEYILNPSAKELETSKLELVVAGNSQSVLMVESEASELSEEVMLGAVLFGHQAFQPVIQAIEALKKEAGKTPWDWQPAVLEDGLENQVLALSEDALKDAFRIQDKQARYQELDRIRNLVVEQLGKKEDGTGYESRILLNLVHDLESKVVRGRLINGETRIDGRDTKTVRPITIKTGFLPRAHGSCLFTRGETQAIVVATLGTTKDSQIIDGPLGEYKDAFMLHYNFPPYSVGEIGMVGSPKRREIGHGRLAKRAINPMLPTQDFPYVLRIVSEITESNGSSSMATVCGSSLALMDAGVAIKNQVAGIAMGLIKEQDKYVILSDILGDEDHLGDMDFKVAGTASGITALQMDIKIDGITAEIMKHALSQAKEGRLFILEKMNANLAKPRGNMSAYAPRIISFRINPEKIREVIGKGGSTIKALTEETGTTIEIEDKTGTVTIASVDEMASNEARRRIELIVADAEIGQIYEGRVVKLVDFGAFVSFLGSKEGLVHISQISQQRVESVYDVLIEGQEVTVKVIDIDRQGKIRLSMKEVTDQRSLG